MKGCALIVLDTLILAHNRQLVHPYKKIILKGCANMAKATKMENGKWRARVEIEKGADGKRRWKSFTADTKKEAEHQANMYAVDYSRNKNKMLNPAQNMTLGEAMWQYIDIKRDNLSAYTIKGYETICRNHFTDIQGLRLCDLTNDIIQTSVNASANRKTQTTDKKGMQKKTLKNVVGFLGGVLKRYHPDFRLTVDIPKGNLERPENVLHEPQTIVDLVRGTDIELAVWLGMLSFRMSEVLGFRKCDCDLENGYITVKQTVDDSKGYKEFRPYAKTEKSLRTVALPNYVVSLIKALPEEQELLVELNRQTITKRFTALLDRNHMAHMRFHDLRHLHASVTQSLGIDDKIRQDMGGWSNPSIMNGTYTEIFRKDRIEADNKVVNFFDEIAKKQLKTVAI